MELNSVLSFQFPVLIKIRNLQSEICNVLVFVVVLGFRHWHDAAVSHFAIDVFELDSGVGNLEVVAQAVFQIAQDAFAD